MKFTKQELFDKAYVAIVKQGAPSYRQSTDTTSGGCVYRGPDGKSCAIGHLLSVELRATVAERPIFNLLENDASVAEFFGTTYRGDDANFLNRLQEAHDHAALCNQRGDGTFLDRFTEAMAEIANVYGLTIPEVA